MSEIINEMLRLGESMQTPSDGSVLVGVCELLGLEPTEANRHAMTDAMARAETDALQFVRRGVMSSVAFSGSGFVTGVAFAVAARRVMERDPRG